MSTAHAIPAEAGGGQASCPSESEEPPRADSVEGDPALALSGEQLAVLAEMREAGMGMVRAIQRITTGKASEADKEAFGRADLCLAFNRASRAVRQIMAMEQEIVGLRAERRRKIFDQRKYATRHAIKRTVREMATLAGHDIERKPVGLMLENICTDYNDYDDYDRGTQAEIIARLCKALGIADPDLSIWQKDAFADVDAEDLSDRDDADAVARTVFGDWREIPDASSPIWRRAESGHDPP